MSRPGRSRTKAKPVFPTFIAEITSQISLRLTSAITTPTDWSITDNRNRQVWFGASMVAYIAKPDLCRAGADYRWISGSVCAAFNSIEPDP